MLYSSVTSLSYRKQLAACTAGSNDYPQAAYMVFGDGGHDSDGNVIPPSESATGLKHQLLKKPLKVITVNSENPLQTVCVATLEENDLLGQTLSEAAVLDKKNRPIGIATFAPKVKGSGESYDIGIRINH